MAQLHELLAVEPDRNKAAIAIYDETVTTFAKRPDHFMAKHMKYTPFDENQAAEAEESSKELVTTVPDKLRHCFGILARAIDTVATKDRSNTLASQAVVLDGVTITPALPATTLLHLESQIKRWIALFLQIPTLAPGRDWRLDPAVGHGVYRDASPDVKFRTKKAIKHKILVEPTEHHPAQIEKWGEDEKVGKVTEVTWCSMMTPGDKSALISRAQELLAAVKEARQRANSQEVVQVQVADALIKYVLG